MAMPKAIDSIMSWTFAGATGLFASLLLAIVLTDTQRFLPGACERADSFLATHVVGQDLATRQLVDAVCTHLKQPHPLKPLIISVHGPPGVGKTFTHTLLARALYNNDPGSATQCPGQDCRGAKVIYGLDFTVDSREAQLGAVRSAILDHAKSASDPLIVIEEYDKLDCPARGMLRQLMQSPDIANASLNRAIVLLESNLGLSELEQMVRDVGREQITPEVAERALRDLVFASWRRTACEDYTATLKLISLIDFFLPYLPLQREQIEELMSRALNQWGSMLWHEKLTQLEWDKDVVQYLTDKVDFDGPFPLEGGKQVANVATRYLARIVRNAPVASSPVSSAHKASSACHSLIQGVVCGMGLKGSPVMKLRVQPGKGLDVEWPKL